MRVVALVLAAGGSRRMGRPKQLLAWRGVPLVRRAAEAALAAPVERVLVVAGAHAEGVGEALAGLPVEIVVHDRWEEGLGSSLAAGVVAARAHAPDAVLVTLADQPLVDAAALSRLFSGCGRGARRAAAEREGILGPPALFPARVLDELAALGGDAGARAVLSRHAAEVVRVPMPEAAFDVDTPDDWSRLDAGPQDRPV
jgi:CTP:molybdopterin cytidylyltransferase MocA